MSNFLYHFKKLGSIYLNIPHICILHFFIYFLLFNFTQDGEINHISKALAPASSKQLLCYIFYKFYQRSLFF